MQLTTPLKFLSYRHCPGMPAFTYSPGVFDERVLIAALAIVTIAAGAAAADKPKASDKQTIR